MHVVGGCLIVSFNAEPDDRELRLLRSRILARIENAAIDGVVLDVSRLRVLDSVLFGMLAKTARTIRLLGKKPVFVGFQAGIASTLVDLDIELDDLDTALTMEDGLEMVRRSPLPGAPRREEDPAEQPEQAGDERLADEQLGQST